MAEIRAQWVPNAGNPIGGALVLYVDDFCIDVAPPYGRDQVMQAMQNYNEQYVPETVEPSVVVEKS